MSQEDLRKHLRPRTKVESRWVLWTSLKRDHLRPTMDKGDNLKYLKAQIGNLEVQNADYQQIVKELSDKLKLYENKYGTVFQPAKSTSDQK